MLRSSLDEAQNVAKGVPVPYAIRDAERRLTDAHAEAVRALLKKAGLVARDAALIGFHGQTILHRPQQRWRWQIGDGATLTRQTGRGQRFPLGGCEGRRAGRSLVPLYHAALVRSAKALIKPVVLNIGGVANVTYVGNNEILAFDTGLGNAPIDDWAHKYTGKPVDESGALAQRGRVIDAVLTKMLANKFFDLKPPKSLDRMDFGMDAVKTLSAEDGAATLTAFMAASIARARDHFPEPANMWIVCGGGRHNPAIVDQLHARLNVPVVPAEDMGWRGDFIEAEAFGYLAARSVKGLPLSLPTTTGVREPKTGGKLHRVNS